MSVPWDLARAKRGRLSMAGFRDEALLWLPAALQLNGYACKAPPTGSASLMLPIALVRLACTHT